MEKVVGVMTPVPSGVCWFLLPAGWCSAEAADCRDRHKPAKTTLKRFYCTLAWLDNNKSNNITDNPKPKLTVCHGALKHPVLSLLGKGDFLSDHLSRKKQTKKPSVSMELFGKLTQVYRWSRRKSIRYFTNLQFWLIFWMLELHDWTRLLKSNGWEKLWSALAYDILTFAHCIPTSHTSEEYTPSTTKTQLRYTTHPAFQFQFSILYLICMHSYQKAPVQLLISTYWKITISSLHNFVN